jgi:hypothetical protein
VLDVSPVEAPYGVSSNNSLFSFKIAHSLTKFPALWVNFFCVWPKEMGLADSVHVKAASRSWSTLPGITFHNGVMRNEQRVYSPAAAITQKTRVPSAQTGACHRTALLPERPIKASTMENRERIIPHPSILMRVGS